MLYCVQLNNKAQRATAELHNIKLHNSYAIIAIALYKNVCYIKLYNKLTKQHEGNTKCNLNL
jgi:hypothetical protein